MPETASRTSLLLRIVAVIGLVLLLAGGWWWGKRTPSANAPKPNAPPVTVTTVTVNQQDLPVTSIANGTVVSLQAVDIRPQITSTISAIHITEGQTVNKGDLLFTLDARSEEANLRKAEAQLQKSRADHANAERNIQRQRELFAQKFISQSALDAAVTQVDVLKGQLAVDEAAVEASRVARSLTQIRAPFAGRTGAIAVRTGSLVQSTATSAPLVTISQVDPIGVSFALPERELAALMGQVGSLPVMVELTGPPVQKLVGKLVFIEGTVDSSSGTIALKAAFANAQRRLWPGMFVNVSLSARTLKDALVVPVQAVQSGPERKFLYVVGDGGKATMVPVEVELNQGGFAAVRGVAAGTRVVVDGAQNVRAGSVVAEAKAGDMKVGKSGGSKSDGPKSGAAGERKPPEDKAAEAAARSAP